MLYEICMSLNNWFDRGQPKFFGTIEISGGNLTGFEDKLQNGQYFRIVGSTFNDGVYQYPATELTEEIFKNGAVWAMAIPPKFLELAAKIAAWETENGGADSAARSPYTSESLSAVYSYSKATAGGMNADGTPSANTWQGAFAADLAKWRGLK